MYDTVFTEIRLFPNHWLESRLRCHQVVAAKFDWKSLLLLLCVHISTHLTLRTNWVDPRFILSVIVVMHTQKSGTPQDQGGLIESCREMGLYWSIHNYVALTSAELHGVLERIPLPMPTYVYLVRCFRSYFQSITKAITGSNMWHLQGFLTKIQVYKDLCMNLGQCQSSIWRTLDHKTTQIWWLTNIEYKYSKSWSLCHCFFLLSFDVSVLTSTHPLLFLGKW